MPKFQSLKFEFSSGGKLQQQIVLQFYWLCLPTVLLETWFKNHFSHMGLDSSKPAICLCEQQRYKSAPASIRPHSLISDSKFSLPRFYNIPTVLSKANNSQF